MDLPHTRPMNKVRGFVAGTPESAPFFNHQEALLALGAKSDLLHVDSYLLDRPDLVNLPVQFDQGSLLHVAAVRGHADLAQMLIQQRGAAIDCTNHRQQTSLHAASEGNYGNIVAELLSAGANADKRDALKQTPLHRAAHCGSSDAMLALLDYGASMKLRDEGGLMAIHKAALMGREECVRILLSRNPEAANDEAADGWSPLHFAGHSGHAATVEVLVAFGADIQALDNERMTPLHRAATSGSEAACQVLLRAGADFMLGDGQRRLPLHLSCEEGCLNVARLLLEAECPVDILDGYRRTPLLIAAQASEIDLCEVLLSYGADPTYSEPSKGVPSPIAVARRGANPALRELLQDYARALQAETASSSSATSHR